MPVREAPNSPPPRHETAPTAQYSLTRLLEKVKANMRNIVLSEYKIP